MNKNASERKLPIVTVPGGGKLLLHACCAPCSGAIVECLVLSGIRPVVFFSNSNITPREEYEKRRDECRRYAEDMGLEFVEDVYDHDNWLSVVSPGLENAPERGPRCLKCFKYRLSRAAAYASSHGFDVLTTTLASSRWKDLSQVASAGGAASSEAGGVTFWDQNWRKGGLQERRGEIIRERCFYNQTFCGCEFSKKRPGEENP